MVFFQCEDVAFVPQMVAELIDLGITDLTIVKMLDDFPNLLGRDDFMTHFSHFFYNIVVEGLF